MTGLSNCQCNISSKQVIKTCKAAASLRQSQASVARGTRAPIQVRARTQHTKSRSAVVEVVNFKFMKKLGLKKPEFLPDFGKVYLHACLLNLRSAYSRPQELV